MGYANPRHDPEHHVPILPSLLRATSYGAKVSTGVVLTGRRVELTDLCGIRVLDRIGRTFGRPGGFDANGHVDWVRLDGEIYVFVGAAHPTGNSKNLEQVLLMESDDRLTRLKKDEIRPVTRHDLDPMVVNIIEHVQLGTWDGPMHRFLVAIEEATDAIVLAVGDVHQDDPLCGRYLFEFNARGIPTVGPLEDVRGFHACPR